MLGAAFTAALGSSNVYIFRTTDMFFKSRNRKKTMIFRRFNICLTKPIMQNPRKTVR